MEEDKPKEKTLKELFEEALRPPETPPVPRKAGAPSATLQEAKLHALPHLETQYYEKNKHRFEEAARRAERLQGPILPPDRQATLRQGGALRALMAKHYPNDPVIGIDLQRLDRGVASTIIEVLSGEFLPSWRDLKDYVESYGAYRVARLSKKED